MTIGYAKGVGSPSGASESTRNLFIFNLIALRSYNL